MSVINQMLRDLDKQQPAPSGSFAAASVVGSPTPTIAGRGQNLLRPLLFLLLAAFIGWLIWPLLQARLQEPVLVSEPKLQPTTDRAQPLAAASISGQEPEIVVSQQPVTALTETVQTEVIQTEAVQTEAVQTEFIQPEAVEVAAIEPQPQPMTATKQTVSKQTATAQTATPVPATAFPATAVSATPMIETPAPVSDSEVYPATPEADLAAPDLSAQTAPIKQPSSMQVEKVVQDPTVVAAEQARAKQLQQLQQLLQLARQASQQQQWQQALQLLQQIPPELSSAESWQLQANAKQQLGDFSGALGSWQQLLLLQPQLAQAWLGKALAHEQLAQPQEARAAYQQAYALPGLSDASRQFIQQRLAQ